MRMPRIASHGATKQGFNWKETLMLIRFIAIALIAINATALAQTKPTTQPRGETLVLSAVIDAPPDEIFECFKTPEGIVKAWGVAQAKNDFRVGGQIRTAYSKE